MRVVSVVTLLVALVAATPPGGRGEGGERMARQAEIRIWEVRVPGSPIPIEGEISYVGVSTRGGTTVRQARIPFGGAWVRIPVGRGSYTVAVWHRTCDANCNYLDPPDRPMPVDGGRACRGDGAPDGAERAGIARIVRNA